MNRYIDNCYVESWQLSKCLHLFQMEYSLAKMVGVILAVWTLAWTPYVVLSGWIILFGGEGLSPGLAIAPTLCCKISASANSLLYGVR